MATLLYGLAGKLLGELCSPVIQHYIGKPWILETKAEFEKLKDTLSAIEAVLLDAEEKQRTNNQVRDWLIKIKLVFYDLEDLLQEFTTESLKRQVMTKNKKAKKVHIFFSRSNQVKYRLMMGRKVKLIRERLDAISSDSNKFYLAQRLKEMSAIMSHRREETHSFVPIDQFIGRHADKEYVTSLLLKSGVLDNVSVVSIVGIGGMGKTTLAQSIYNSEDVDKCMFDLKIWVCVSDPFDVKLICKNIIASATQETCERLPMEVVKEKLKNIIDGRKFLIVLDDVWNESSFEWMKLELLLTGGARGSKILITARAELVARAAKSIATHVLKGLSYDESWALFKQIAFKRGVEQVSPTIEGIGKEVLEKCAGVPLVVKAIGSLLAFKDKEIDWLDFKKYDLPRITQDSEGTVLPILRLSYDYLPAPLKRCFVFCAIYPKDYLIEKKRLINMWIAHGLIQLDDTTRSLEDVGERHFIDLLDRSFFEGYEPGYNVRNSFYKMHDLNHDLAQSVGGDEYYNRCSVANYVDRSTRHAWISRHEPTNLCHGEKLRTLVVLTQSCDQQLPLTEITSKFEQLRVLVWLGLPKVPQFVGGLRHLYYLDLSYNKFVSLPESICRLHNLQTLILSGCRFLKEMPTRTRDLVSLRRLDVSYCEKLRHMPRGLEELTCLQTLSNFVTGGSLKEGGKRRNCAEVCELKSLVNLRGLLEIKNLRASKCAKCKRNRSCILIELKFIKHLDLKWDRSYRLKVEEEQEELFLIESLKPHPNLEKLIIRYYDGKKFPSWMDRVNIGVSLPSVVSVCLDSCRSWRHLPPLGLLPSLQQLHVGWMDGIVYLIDSSLRSSVEEEADQLFFPSLKELYLRGMPKLTRLVGPTAASRTANTTTTNNRYFPVLEKLVIVDCPLFLDEDGKQFLSLREVCVSGAGRDRERVPAWLGYLPHLHILKLTHSEKIVSLPEWMANLTSLQELHLDRLDSLASLPDCMHRLTSLQQLVIKNCSKLESRCEMETGADWHKIAHIPNILVKKKQ